LLTDVFGAVDFSGLGGCPTPFLLSALTRCFETSPSPSVGCYVFRRTKGRGEDDSGLRLRITGDIEIHNRSELIEKLSQSGVSHVSSDARLVVAAYERWGEQCPEHLLGEFAFAIWDPARASLFCCRDHMGHRPFLYWTRGAVFAFSSDFNSLTSMAEIGAGLNRSKLASLQLPLLYQPRPDETLFEGVLSL
jgi:asparagine synthase (glutamine-hydrolysing)